MAEVVRAHYDDVWRFCARQLGDELASDAAQETFVTAQQRARTFQGRSALRTWLFGIALNHCRNLRRKGRSHASVDWLDGEPAPHRTEDEAIDRERLRAALRTLSQDHRDVVLLHEIEGLDYAEIGALLRVPAGTVKSRLHHAFRNLRHALQDGQDGPR
jgi:RNA polymerase sigma-70 factor (ECF subfamily)